MNFDYSAKSIPLADERTYNEMMIYAVEKFGKELTWRAWHKLNPNAKTTNKETFDLKSTKAPPNVPELKPFKEGLAKLVKNVKFKERSNTFMGKLNMEIKRVDSAS